jgi:DNA polymerase I-like protein with 3'-5' exonuclease and polymerase domains
VHDELQYECKPEHAEKMMKILEESAVLAGEYYQLRCPIAAEAKEGLTWHDVH